MEFGCDWDTVPNSLAGSEPGLNRARKIGGKSGTPLHVVYETS